MKVKNFEEVVKQIQLHLNDYLTEKGIDTTKLFKCINPAHNDKSPSCGTGGSNIFFHCFGCGDAGDLFKAAHYLEAKPLAGKEFIVDNLLYLANKYGIAVDSTEMTEDEIYEMDTYRAYKLASELVTANKDKSFLEAIKTRGWKKETCTSYSVGSVTSFKDFRDSLKSFGFPATFLDDIDLGRKELFDNEHIIFTVKDEHGRPVGFASRNLKYTEDKLNGAKYVNQKTTGAKCNIYKKGSRLFGIDQLVKKHRKKSDPVYVFEGYGDVLTAAQYGLTNSVAVGGTAFTVDQLQLLKDNNFYNIVLCLDGDQAGRERTAAILDSTLGGHKDIRVGIVIIPEEGMDPDDFIRSKGIEAFTKLKVWSAFEWRLLQFPDSADPETICSAMVPLIVNESSSIAQEKMIKALAKQTGVSVKAIQADVTQLQNSKEAERERERRNIIDKMIRSLQKNPLEAESAIQESQALLFEIARKYNEDSFSEDSTLAFLDEQKVAEENKSGLFSGFVMGPDLLGLQEALSGESKKDVWMVYGGKANAGKTSLLCKIGFEIARRIAENNAIVIYHTIDDTKEQVLPKFVCIADGSKKLSINQVRDPNYHIKPRKDAKTLSQKRESAYEVIRNLLREGRLVLKDANDGASLAYADRLICYYRAKYPDRNIVYVLDNFHKLQDFQGNGDERNRVKMMSTKMKDLATRHHIAVLSTVEYTKLEAGIRPSNNNIIETVQIEYDANLICHLYNDLHELQGQAVHYHDQVDGDSLKRLPRIEAIIGKNKITDIKGSLWFDFYPASSDFVGVDPRIPEEEAKKSKEYRKYKRTPSLLED